MASAQPGITGPLDTVPRGMPPVPGPGGQWRVPGRMPGGGRRLIPAIVAVGLAIVAVVGVVVVLQSMRGGTSTPPTTSPSSTPTSATAVSTQAQQQAATQLAGLLSQSGNDRGAVIDAVVNVENCGKALARDERTFNRAAANRDSLLTRLSNLPGRSTLPAPMISALTTGWQASAQADSDLAKWAGDEMSGCDKSKVQNDPSYQASLGPDNQATTGKQAFTRMWNPLARRYGLPTYQLEQI